MLKGKRVKITYKSTPEITFVSTIEGKILDEDEWGFIIYQTHYWEGQHLSKYPYYKQIRFEYPSFNEVKKSGSRSYKKKIHLSRSQISEMELLT